MSGEIVKAEPPTLLEYLFGMGEGAVELRVRIEHTPETEAVQVKLINDEFSDDDPAYIQNADGWPRVISRLKPLLKTEKTFRPHEFDV